MSGAIDSKVDASVLNAMRAWRRCTDEQPEEKLALLRRLRRQYETGSLPKHYSETQVEQSFNEQIFARVFGYRTLLSHDGRRSSHHIQAKSFVPGTGKFPDFAIGEFSAGNGVVIASAELKGPGAPLDEKQSGNYKGLSPVQQAFQAVKGEQACIWIIVCNYSELRLYRRVDLPKDDDVPPPFVVAANLHDVWDKNDLARLCAHFDRRALLGTVSNLIKQPRSELMAALERHHPAEPIPKETNAIRAVLLFTPRVEEDLPLFLLERRLREAITNSKLWPEILGATGGSSRPPVRLELAEGSITAIVKDGGGRDCCKASVSGLGQLQVSVSRELDAKRVIGTRWLVDVVAFFVTLVDDVFDGLSEACRPGRVSPELREVKGVTLEVTPEHQDGTLPSSGVAMREDVLGVDFTYTPVLDKADVLIASVVSELAIYFRAANGGVGLNRARVVGRSK